MNSLDFQFCYFIISSLLSVNYKKESDYFVLDEIECVCIFVMTIRSSLPDTMHKQTALHLQQFPLGKEPE